MGHSQRLLGASPVWYRLPLFHALERDQTLGLLRSTIIAQPKILTFHYPNTHFEGSSQGDREVRQLQIPYFLQTS